MNFRTSLRTLLLLNVLVATTCAERGHDYSKVPAKMAPYLASNERAIYVRTILSRRLEHVTTGKRLKDFAKWVKERGGEASVFSMHGVDVHQDFQKSDTASNNTTVVTDLLHENDPEGITKDPFPRDRLNLDLYETPTTPPSLFTGPPMHLTDVHPPNVWELALRALRLGVHFTPVLSTLGLAVIHADFRQKVWYAWLASCIGSSGAAWIKWGQWASTRSDMFPEALCDQLATLHSEAPAHSWKYSQAVMESTLGLAHGSLHQVFDEFDTKPIASGSIAQVHKAILNGQLIAVKIRHPHVARRIDMDFRLMTAAARLLDALPALAWLHISESVAQFRHTMAAQSYLHVEGHHLEVLNYNFRSWSHVHFPRPFYASSAVILETFEPGRIVTEVLDYYERRAAELKPVNENQVEIEEVDNEGKPLPSNRSELQGNEIIPLDLAQFIVSTGVSIYLKMLLIDNLMHADLHPGNLMIEVLNPPREHATKSKSTAMVPWEQTEGARNIKRRYGITLVDAGMVAQLTDEESSIFIGLLASLGEGNGKEAAEFALQFSLENHFPKKEKEAFIEDMEALFAERCRGYGTNVDVGDVLRGILGLIRYVTVAE